MLLRKLWAFLVLRVAALPQIVTLVFVGAMNLAASPAVLAASNCNASGATGSVWGCVPTYPTPPYAWAQQTTVQSAVGMISIGLGLVALVLVIFFAWRTAALLVGLFFHESGAQKGAEELKTDMIVLGCALGGGVLFATGIWFPFLIGILQMLFDAVVSVMGASGGHPLCVMPGQTAAQSC